MVSNQQLPHELQQLLGHARVQVLANKRNGLPRPMRIQVLLALGPRLKAPTKPPYAIAGAGLTRRTNLCVLVVEKVHPIWQRHYPDIPAVADMLLLARQRLREEITHDQAFDGRSEL